jgi:farnesyl-diphosphate farnesyltransferase
MSSNNSGRAWAILRSVSRSFYLSIRILPARLREPVALAYLLARSTDTVADTTQIAIEIRAEILKRLSNRIQQSGTDSSRVAPDALPTRDAVVDLGAPFVLKQANVSERLLLESLPNFLDWLEQLESEDRDDIRVLLKTITEGQMLDLLRFDDPTRILALKNAGDLDRYTYLVAGCVGEFWTHLCFRHLRNFATMSEAKMLELGKHYGMGLQLINVLRDAGTDLHSGRCYFSEEELAAARMTPEQILREPERFQPIYRKWIDKAKRGLEAGMQYVLAIRNRRVRAATALPALIGARTLALLRDAGPTALHRKIKVPRREVRELVMSIITTLASRKQLDAIFKKGRGD